MYVFVSSPYVFKQAVYRGFQNTAFAAIDIWAGQQTCWFADPEGIKIITADRHIFPESVAEYEALDVFGGNLLSTEGPDWKRHRSVAMSSFNEVSSSHVISKYSSNSDTPNVALVWSESLRIINDWFEQLDVIGPDATVNLVPAIAQVRSSPRICEGRLK